MTIELEENQVRLLIDLANTAMRQAHPGIDDEGMQDIFDELQALYNVPDEQQTASQHARKAELSARVNNYHTWKWGCRNVLPIIRQLGTYLGRPEGMKSGLH